MECRKNVTFYQHCSATNARELLFVGSQHPALLLQTKVQTEIANDTGNGEQVFYIYFTIYLLSPRY